MTIFDIISSILFDKNKNKLVSVDEETVFAPFIVNRWLSMYSPEIALKSNILNKYLTVFENKKELFNFFVNVFPKVKAKRISYFKRKQDKLDKSEDIIKLVAKAQQLSKREIQSNIDLLKTLNKS